MCEVNWSRSSYKGFYVAYGQGQVPVHHKACHVHHKNVCMKGRTKVEVKVKVTADYLFRKITYDFLYNFNSNERRTSYRFEVIGVFSI